MTIDRVFEQAKLAAKQSKESSRSLLSDYEEMGDVPGYLQFLSRFFPHVASKPLAERHYKFWRWVDSIELGIRVPPRVEVWPRGGGKSSTAELGVARMGCKLTRRYALYVSETQDQADKHVAAISTLLEQAGLERSVNKYGSSKGWRRNQLRAANGFNVEALGLDTAARGIKLDEFRPDLIIFDDIDNREDNRKTTDKKIRAITNSILPSGSTDCCVLFIQNLIIEDGIVAQLVSGEANFLLDRQVSDVEPAVRNLKFELRRESNGLNVPFIIGGEATWEGQSLDVCQAQMRDWGPDSFLRESQHEVENADGVFFKVREIVDYDTLEKAPKIKRIFVSFDVAATEGGGDYTAGAAVADCYNGTIGVLNMVREQWGTDNVETGIEKFVKDIKEEYPGVLVTVMVPRDLGAAGKLWAEPFAIKLRKLGYDASVYSVTKAKHIVAKNWQSSVNAGNAWFLTGPWVRDCKTEHKDFREDQSHENDDQVDAIANAVNRAKTAPQQTSLKNKPRQLA